MEVVQPRFGRRRDLLLVPSRAESDLVPLHAGLREISVGNNLRRGAWPVIVEPPEVFDQHLLPAVAPQGEFVGVGGVNAKLGVAASGAPFRPDVAQQTIREQAK